MNTAESNKRPFPCRWSTHVYRFIFLMAGLALVANQSVIAQAPREIKLWPHGLPNGAVKFDAAKAKELIEAQKEHPRGHILFVDTPTLTVFRAPKASANRSAVVICPGGGYNVLAWQHEGVELAQWFNSIGVTAFILKYRVPRRISENIHFEPMQDVQRAIRLVRHEAKKYAIDSDRIGVLGFSAGGHLAVMSAVQYATRCYEPTDEIDAESARPDFACPIYPAYLADDYRDDIAELGSLVSVNQQTPPMFLAVTWGDKMRGAQSALLFSRLKEHDVPSELHVYQHGGHGYGIRKSKLPVSNWHHHLETWLELNGYLKTCGDGKTTNEQKH